METVVKKSRREGWQGMNWITQHKRLAIYMRDDFICAHCNMDLRKIQAGDGYRIELDHIIPVSKGGSNHAHNLVTSCNKCNLARGDRDLEVIHPMYSVQIVILNRAKRDLPIQLAKQVIEDRKAARKDKKEV